MNRLEGRVAMVTGGGRGLGAAIARRFREEGAALIINDVNPDAAAQVAMELDGIAIAANVSDSLAVAAMFAEVEQRGLSLDVLVNNAGISGLEGNSELLKHRASLVAAQAQEVASGEPIQTHFDVTMHMTDEDWHDMIGVHLNGTFFCTREALKIMTQRPNGGAIVNMGSINGTMGSSTMPHYSAAKAGILGLTRALARELATRQIRVNAIAPGWIDTDMTAPLGDMRASLARTAPLGRFGDVDDIAWAAVYLASDEAKYLTGQVISPNGGVVMSQ